MTIFKDDISDCENVEITIMMMKKSKSKSKSECAVHNHCCYLTYNLSCK